MSDYINPDLLVLILKCFPVESLLRCRSVCKSWKQLIESTSFKLKHLAAQNPPLIVQNKSFKYLLIDPQTLPTIPFFETLRGPSSLASILRWCVLVNTIHGIICLYRTDIFFLWNPSLRRLVILPLTEGRNTDDFEYHGFWIDPSTNHYKVVIFCLESKSLTLYSSIEREWSEVAMVGVDEFGGLECRQVIANGVGYWLAYIIGDDTCSGVIFYFDFLQDKYGIIEMPGEWMEVRLNSNLCKWQDCLSVVHWEIGFIHECDLWVMQNGSWSKMFSFNLDDGLGAVLCVVNGHGRVLAENYRGDLVLFDPKDGCVRIKSKFAHKLGFSVAYDFVESLVFPEGRIIGRG